MTGTAVPRRSLSDDLAGSIVSLIQRQGLGTGDQLESVRSLSTRFGVAVPTIREALRRLEATGVVEMRHGSGIYVGPNLGRWVLTNPTALEPSRAQLIELLEARMLIEPSVAAAAARRHDQAAIDRMRRHLERAQECIDTGDWQSLTTLNMSFHQALAAASGNAMVAEVVDSITSVNAREQLEILKIHGDRQTDHDEHVTILDAVAHGDPVAAEQITRKHLNDVLEVVRERTTAGQPDEASPSTGSKRIARRRS